MNKDEMDDDAEFEAFLKGEGDLSRALQGMPQPSPSAALDAAILGRIRTSMEQQQQAAANDPGEAVPAPRLARGLGMRWRVPAGIAASALVGLFAIQAYRSNVSGDLVSAPAQERAADAILEQERAAVPAAPAPAAEPVAPPAIPASSASEARSAPPEAIAQSPLPQSAPSRNSVEKELAVAKRSKPVASDMADAYRPPPAPVIASADVATPAPAPAAAPAAPAPAVVAPSSEAAAKAAVDAQAGLFEAERRRAESRPTAKLLREAPAAAAPPAPAPADARPAPLPPAPTAVTNATNVKPTGGPYPLDYTSVTVTGSTIKRQAESNSPSALWIERIEALLKDGREDAALREWIKFREKYPNQQVSPQLEEKMKALAEQGR